MGKLSLLAAAGAGYVLGAKAGRQRYEQIKRLSRQVKENPKVQGVAGMVGAQAESVVETVKSKVTGSDDAPKTTGQHAAKSTPSTGTHSTGTSTTTGPHNATGTHNASAGTSATTASKPGTAAGTHGSGETDYPTSMEQEIEENPGLDR